MRTATRRVAQVAAQWPRPAALSGSQLKPPALPGDTYLRSRALYAYCGEPTTVSQLQKSLHRPIVSD